VNAVEVADLQKSFGRAPAVRNISFSIDEGEIVSLLGPSGCGKTTTLRCIAGLEVPDHGEITIRGETAVRVDGKHKHVVPAEARGVSMVFQNYALWPHMTVWDNVAFGVRLRTRTRSEIVESTRRALEMVKLHHLRDRGTSQLSGGQQQRVALARALAFEPRLVLFDEPLSNLDAKLRDEMRLELLQLQRDLGFSALYVTHDQQEATGLSSRIVIMRDGHIEQEGTPRDIWASPASGFVAEFLGHANRVDGVLKGAPEATGGRFLHTDFGPVLPVVGHDALPDGARVSAYVNYGKIALRPAGAGAPPPGDGWALGQIRLVSFRGYAFLVRVAFGTGDLIVRADQVLDLREGEDAYLRIAAEDVDCFAAE